jgi:hypothetical protein
VLFAARLIVWFEVPLGSVVTNLLPPDPVLSSEKILWAMSVASVSRMLSWDDFSATGSMPTMAMIAKDMMPSAITTSTKENAGRCLWTEGELAGREWLFACIMPGTHNMLTSNVARPV